MPKPSAVQRLSSHCEPRRTRQLAPPDRSGLIYAELGTINHSYSVTGPRHDLWDAHHPSGWNEPEAGDVQTIEQSLESAISGRRGSQPNSYPTRPTG